LQGKANNKGFDNSFISTQKKQMIGFQRLVVGLEVEVLQVQGGKKKKKKKI
jgi:hypothetical protein